MTFPNADLVMLYIVLVYGVTESPLFAPVRFPLAVWVWRRRRFLLVTLVYCPMCIGTWLALGLAWLGCELERFGTAWDAFGWALWLIAGTIVYKGIWPDAHTSQGDRERYALKEIVDGDEGR